MDDLAGSVCSLGLFVEHDVADLALVDILFAFAPIASTTCDIAGFMNWLGSSEEPDIADLVQVGHFSCTYSHEFALRCF